MHLCILMHNAIKYLLKISKWAYQGKMPFNPNGSKQAQEVVFSGKSHKFAHPAVLFNNVPFKRCSIQNHLGIHLDETFNFNHHVKEKITKANKGTEVIKTLIPFQEMHCLLFTNHL